LVPERHLMDLARLPEGNEVEDLRRDAVALSGDARVAEPVPALETIERTLDGHERRRPVVRAVDDVVVTPAAIHRHVVVAIAGDPPESRVSVEAVAAAEVRDEAEEALRPEIVDPRVRRLGSGDDVFAVLIVEMAETHVSCSEMSGALSFSPFHRGTPPPRRTGRSN